MHFISYFVSLPVYGSLAAFYYPDPQYYLLEHILVDNWGAHASNFSSAITPCTRYVTEVGDAAINSGRTTAAQWVRVLFHDFITADVSAGTGGVDASIGFETARAENKGSAFNDSFTFWSGFMNSHVPMADVVALGTVMANNLCGNKTMPYRPGRVDATGPDSTTGVPAPETSLEETLEFFERAGFNSVDSIGLTACGHTLGSVHHGGFPEVVDSSSVSPTNTNGGANFDSTRGVFDPLVVQEYLAGTGQRGGPLVTSFNKSSRSDLRLYESDGNATMYALRKQGDGFLDTCIELLGRAMNTVPSNVNLKDNVKALEIKPINATFDFDVKGELIFSGSIRILNAAGALSQPSIGMSINEHDIELTAERERGTSVFGRDISGYGSTVYYPFMITGNIARSATSFSVKAKSFSVQNDVFVIPSLSTLNTRNLTVSVALASPGSCTDIQASVKAPVTQSGTLAPRVVVENIALRELDTTLDEYIICSTATVLEQVPRGLVTVTVAKNRKFVDTLLIGGEMAGW